MIATAEAFIEVNDVKAGRQLALLPADGLGRRRGLHARHGAGGAAYGATARRARRPCSATCASSARRHAGAAAHLGEHADRVQVQGQRRLAAEAPGVRVLPRAGRARGVLRAATASRCRSATRVWPALWASSSSTGPSATSSACASARWCYTGGAPLGPDTFRFFRSFGVNLKQVYGSTETTGADRLPARRRGQSQHGRAGRARASRSRSTTAARCW